VPARAATVPVRRYRTPHTPAPHAQLLSNGQYVVAVTNGGGGASAWRGQAVTRWRRDATCDPASQAVFLRDVRSGACWSAGYQPTRTEPDDYVVTFHPDKATPSALLPGQPAPLEDDETTHFSIIDAEGNRVSATQTVNLLYGSGMVAPGTGVLLNNEMDDFALRPGTPNAFGVMGFAANAPAPGKRMLSSMTPSFIESRDRLSVLGAPGRLVAGFSVKDAGASGGLNWLALTPKGDNDAGLRSAKLGFGASGLNRMEFVDARGQRTRIDFSGWKRNPTFPAGKFKYVRPKGVDLIGEG